jgi:antibiotic biosynthesis monooxygenase (ABM) superfamily enzyme
VNEQLYVITAKIRAKPGCVAEYEALVRTAILQLKRYPCFVRTEYLRVRAPLIESVESSNWTLLHQYSVTQVSEL